MKHLKSRKKEQHAAHAMPFYPAWRPKVFHAMALAILAEIIVLGSVRVPQIYIRFFESLRDVFHEIGSIAGATTSTSSQFSSAMTTEIPQVWSEFVNVFKNIGLTLISPANMLAYLRLIGRILLYSSVAIILLGGLVAVPVGLAISSQVKAQNNRYAGQSKPLRCFMRFYDRAYMPAKRFVKRFFRFFGEHAYKKALILIAVFFFNGFTVGLEFVAWLFHYASHADVTSIGVQLIKLVYDVTVAVRFLPIWIWIPFGLWIFTRWRKSIGFSRLEKQEKSFRKFLEERPIFFIVTAPMRSGKTTFLASTAITYDKLFRNMCKKAMREIQLKFPNFPWITLEKVIQRGAKKHELYNLAHVRKWADKICEAHKAYQNDPYQVRIHRKMLSRKYGIRFDNILFGYDTKRWPTVYDRGLGKETIYDAIHDFSQLYRLQLTPSMLLSNFPIRMDDDLQDRGNEIQWDDDFYRKDPSPIDRSRMAHIVHFDMFRPGKKVDPQDKYKDAFEYGVAAFTEFGKERGNQFDRAGKKVEDEEANILNDLFNLDIKMRGHSATVAYNAFLRIIADEQRASSLNADLVELGDIIVLREKGKQKILLPFFAIEEAIYLLSEKLLGKLFDEAAFNRGDQTLLLWFLQNVVRKKIYDHYQRAVSVFGGYKVKGTVQAGTKDVALEQFSLFMSNRKNYANVFQTDAWQDSYNEKTLKSPTGIDDVPCFATTHAKMSEHRQEGSYHFQKLDKYYLESEPPEENSEKGGQK